MSCFRSTLQKCIMSACGLQDGTAHYSLATGKHLEMFYFTSIVKIHLWPTVLKKKKHKNNNNNKKAGHMVFALSILVKLF